MTCPIPDCTHPAGTACTMTGCPGTSLRPRSLTGERKGGGVSSPSSPPTFDPRPFHMSDDKGGL
jgi:hypothetical protein